MVRFASAFASLLIAIGSAPTAAAQWVQVPGSLVQVSVGNATTVWGVMADRSVHRFVNGTWLRMQGAIKQISVAADGAVRGVMADTTPWRIDGNGNWLQVPGNLKQIAAGSASNIWGVMPDNTIWHWEANNWQHVAGALANISVASDGTVWGVHPDNSVHRRSGNQWIRMPGTLAQISVGSASNIWGVMPDNTVWRWDGSNWQRVDGTLKHVSAAADGSVWGIHPSNSIWRRDTSKPVAFFVPPTPPGLQEGNGVTVRNKGAFNCEFTLKCEGGVESRRYGAKNAMQTTNPYIDIIPDTYVKDRTQCWVKVYVLGGVSKESGRNFVYMNQAAGRRLVPYTVTGGSLTPSFN